MIRQMRTQIVKTGDRSIKLGVQFENNALQVQIPIADWLLTYGLNGRFELLARRDGEQDAYTVQAVESDSEYVYWTVSSVDTAIAGDSGEAILHYYVDDTLAKSRKWWTEVELSLGDAGDVPEPYRPQIEIVLQAAREAKDDADRAEQSAREAEEAADSAESVVGRALPEGGVEGQWLRKTGEEDGAAEWADLPVYDGAYEVTPVFDSDLTLRTGAKYTDRDIVVRGVRVLDTLNGAGGYTAEIG